MATYDSMTALTSPGVGLDVADVMDQPEAIVVRERVLVMTDGVRLPLSTWEPACTPRATVIGVHAFGDFRLAFAEAGPALARRGFRVHAYDQRGFGDTDGRGRWHGWRRLVRDLKAVIRILRPSDGSRLFLLGESMGGGVALVATARFRPEPVDGLILVEPAVRRGIRLRLMWDVAFATLALVAPGYSRRLARGTHAEFTPAARERLGQDPRIVRFIRADAYKGLLSLADAASASTRRLRLPTLFLYGRADGIIPLRLFEQAVRDLRPLVTALRYPSAPHLLLQTHSLDVVLDDICAWLDGVPLPASGQSVLMRSGPRPASPADARHEPDAPHPIVASRRR
jgi:acylglycerol lipase